MSTQNRCSGGWPAGIDQWYSLLVKHSPDYLMGPQSGKLLLLARLTGLPAPQELLKKEPKPNKLNKKIGKSYPNLLSQLDYLSIVFGSRY